MRFLLHHRLLLLICLSFSLFDFAFPLQGEEKEPIPDLTQTTVEDTKKDFLLGPTGLRGWIYTRKTRFSREDFTDNLSTEFARQILVTEVEKGSPADGHLQKGDVIIGLGTEPFSHDPRMALADAINEAEKTENHGALKLLVWRSEDENRSKGTGKKSTVILTLPTLGTYSLTAPYDCHKTKKLREQTIEAVYREELKSNLSIWALALLATGEERHLDKVKEHIQSLVKSVPEINKKSIQKGHTWPWAYRLILLSEYHLKTGDPTVLDAIKDYAILLSMGQSVTGTWGHYMAQPFYSINGGQLHGRLEGYATLNQPSLMAFMSLVLAQKCGVQHPEFDRALSNVRDFYSYYIHKGAINYGYGFPKEYLLTNNGTSGSAAVTFSLLEDKLGAGFFSKLCGAAAHKVEIGHTGAFFNSMWTGLGANIGGPELYSAYFANWTPLRTLTRKWNGGYVFQRAGGGKGQYGRIGPSSAMLLHLCLPLRQLHITGKDQDQSLWVNQMEAWAIANLRHIDYRHAEVDDLFMLLGSEFPVVRRRAAKALADRDVILIDRVLKHLNGSRHQKVGACHTLGAMKEDAAPAIDPLMDMIRNPMEELWIRNLALFTLINIGDPAKRVVPELLERLSSDTTGDPRRHHEIFLAKAITSLGEKPYPQAYPRELVFSAARKLLNHPHMRGRMEGMYLIEDLELKDFHLFSEQLVHVIRNQDPSYLDYHYDRPAKLGLNILNRLNIKEAMDLCIETIHPGIWGQRYRVSGKRGRLAFIQKFGSNAKPYTDQLQTLLGAGANITIDIISSSNLTRPLITMEEAVQAGLKGN